MGNNKKKKVIIISVIATLLLILLIGGTIAYFGWSGDESLVDVTVSSGTGSCTKLSDNNILLEPTSTKEKGRILKMTAKQEMADKAYITWDLVVNAINGLQDKTFVYELVNTTTGTVYTSNGTGNFENVSAGDTITFSSDELLDYNKDYEFTLYLWIDGTIGNNPLTMADQVFDFDISCNITGTTYIPTIVEYITNLYTEASKTTVTNNSIEYNYASSVSLMNDRLGGTTSDYNAGNIRYYGSSPNNYIYFNCSDYANQSDTTCEKWRIIGVFDGKVKIIRNESIGDYSWDNKDTSTGAKTNYGKNDWTTARLMKLLNPSNYFAVDANDNGLGQSLYYTAGSGTCYSGKNNATISCDFTSAGLKNDTTRNMIEEVTWNLGGWKTSNGVYSNQIYGYERGTKVYSGRPTSWTGKIALMYPSDYGYATDFNKCTKDLYNYDSNTDSYACRTNDWLYNSAYQWLLTPTSSNAYRAWYVTSSGRAGSDPVYFAFGVRPVLYLNSELVIESGDGSSSLPYRLSVS